MKKIDVKRLVAEAVESTWSDFANEHPHLAAAIDQPLLIEQAADLLEDDPGYREAMRKAQAVEMVGDGIESFVTTWIARWLRSLG
jgi:hypothetical protein